jgi:hypothetical protein
MPRRISTKTIAVSAAVVAWLGTVGVGMAWLSAYAGKPGTPANPPENWPAASSIARRSDTPTVLVFAHPNCPCTRATLGELDWVLAHVASPADVHVLLLEPTDADRSWSDGGLEHLAAAIPNVQVEQDTDGREAAHFGVATSGEVLLYDGSGRLRFAGGITGGRGHAGDNPGRDGFAEQLTAATGAATSSPVFGCGLFDPPTT